jgi:hypothetical protein
LEPEGGDLSLHVRSLPSRALDKLAVFRAPNGRGYLQQGDSGLVHSLDSPQAPTLLLKHILGKGYHARPKEVREALDELAGLAALTDDVREVWCRVGPVPDGIELDLADPSQSRVRVTPGKVELVPPTSAVLFERHSSMLPLPVPAEEGDWSLVYACWNLHPVQQVLVRAWCSFTLAHCKRPGTTFPLLFVTGPQGAGKSVFCRILLSLLCPSASGIQALPRTEKDLVLATQRAHVVAFDNVRQLSPATSDLLCIVSTGGSLPSRKLYSDSTIVDHRLHAAVIANGLHYFVDQQDLAQRCVPIHLQTLEGRPRRAENEILDQFQRDRPRIFRGLLDTVAAVLTQLPSVKPINPERLYGFSHWLAAMERADGVPDGVYQSAYSSALDEGMLDALLEDPTAAAVLEFLDKVPNGRWSGSPSELLEELDGIVGRRATYSPDWPKDASSLSKRLRALEAGLLRHGVQVHFGRGRGRYITFIRNSGNSNA